MKIGWRAISIASALLLGCGSDASDFEGLWSARSLVGDHGCEGHYEESSPMFTMRLRAGKDADLEYVSLLPDLTTETCVQNFSVDGDVAEIEANQDCTAEFEGTDPATGDSVLVTQVMTFSQDRLELDGDRLLESAKSRTVTSVGTDCTDDFEMEFERVKED